MTVETFKSWNTVMSILRERTRPPDMPLDVTPAQRVKAQARRAANRPLSKEGVEKQKLMALPSSLKG